MVAVARHQMICRLLDFVEVIMSVIVSYGLTFSNILAI